MCGLACLPGNCMLAPMFRSALLVFIICGMLLAGCSAEAPAAVTPFQTPTQVIGSATPTLSFLAAAATPWPTLTPTQVPAAQILTADRALFIGDWSLAAELYGQALAESADTSVQVQGALGIARIHLLQNDPARALNSLRELQDKYPFAENIPESNYFLGMTFAQLQRYEEAAIAFQAYVDVRPGTLDSYVLELSADAWLNAGKAEQAAATYRLAAAADRLNSADAVELKLAQAELALGESQAALSRLQTLTLSTTNDFIKAESNFRQAEIHQQLGETIESNALLQENVRQFPVAFHSYLSLQSLDKTSEPISELDRGLVLYFAGEAGLAVSAFERFLSTANAEHDGTAHHFQALALRQIGSYARAIAEWQVLIDTHEPTDARWAEAWDDIGYTQWAFNDDSPGAVLTFSNFADAAPESPRAPEMLASAAWVAERDGQLQTAIDIWRRIDLEFPTHSLAFRSAFLAGVGEYRLSQFPAALDMFRRASQIAVTAQDQASASYWIGKSEMALGFSEAANATWQQTASLDPTGYYSERALDLLLDRPPFAPPETIDFSIDWASERQQAETWLKATFGLDSGVELAGLGPLADDVRVVRGSAFWRLGEHERARAEFEALRSAISGDPAANYRLTNYLLELGLYRTAIFTARQVLNLAGMDDAQTLGAPNFFNHVRFGLYYSDLVLPLADDAGLHALLVYSVIRQESLFEGFVRSSAGARGLMQIIPATGQQIFNNMGWPSNYQAGDLYRPLVNVTYGIDYLSDQYAFLDDSTFAALAAYNAGPGNARQWLDLSPDDPDLLLEIVRFSETRQYIRGVYEIFSIYRRIYDRTP